MCRFMKTHDDLRQVLTPELANKLVLNRGAVFDKYSFAKGRVGFREKAPRLVWVSNDKRIMWQVLLLSLFSCIAFSLISLSL